MQGKITKGTTINGVAVNAGAIVDLGEDDFQKLKLTGDIEPIPDRPKSETPKTAPAEHDSKPVVKKKK